MREVSETNKQVTLLSRRHETSTHTHTHTRSGLLACLLRHQKRSIAWWGVLGFGWTVDLARCSLGKMRLARVEGLKHFKGSGPRDFVRMKHRLRRHLPYIFGSSRMLRIDEDNVRRCLCRARLDRGFRPPSSATIACESTTASTCCIC